MKKILILIVALMAIAISACSPGNGDRTYEIALITDVGTIDDKSFNQGAWEGVKKYAEEHNITYKYYQPVDKTTEEYVASIELAVSEGAKVIVTPGFLFEPAIYQAQDMFPDVKFILLDGFPNDGNWAAGPDFRIEDNVHSIFYAEEEVGFLAGYTAVQEGFTSLGFMGGMAVPAVVRFGYGFVQGAEFAAAELGVEVTLQYTYLGDFEPSAAHQTRAASWFTQGIEVIFVAAGGAGNSVMAAAEAASGKVIGVDVDQKDESPTVIVSAMKDLTGSVYNSLSDFYNGTFKGGVSEVLDAAVNGVYLSEDFSRLQNFSRAEYEAFFEKFVDDVDGVRSGILGDQDITSASEIPVEFVTLSVVQ